MTPFLPLRLVLPVAALLLVSACGGSDSSGASASASGSATSSPSASVTLAAGQQLTEAGSQLSFGDAATVAFTANQQKATGLKLVVTKLARGRISDLSAYQLDATTKASTPYYASVRVENVGTGDVGSSAIPLYGLSSSGTLVGASGFTSTFAQCPSRALPTAFAAGAELTTCLVYLVPKGGTLAGISYRPLQSTAPIVWKGTVVNAATPSAPAKAKAKTSTPKG